MVRRTTRGKSVLSTEVLVVGAGPAGLAAATNLAAQGAGVVLIDRHAAPGKKACAGGLTREGWHLAGISSPNPPAFASLFDSILVRTGLGDYELNAENGETLLMTVDRVHMQRLLLLEATASGVNVRLKERLLRVDDRVAETSIGRIKFDVLVGADGAASRIRRHIGLPPGTLLRAMQVRLPLSTGSTEAVASRVPSIWFNPALMRSGYGWAFPFKNEVRLGLSMEAPVQRGLKPLFAKWLSTLGLDIARFKLEAGTIPCGYAGHRFGRFYLAGDAAGLASPLTGEGILQALCSGKEVAREIAEPAYRSQVIPRLARQHRRTHDALASTALKHLLCASPWVLRVPSMRRAALRRYVRALGNRMRNKKVVSNKKQFSRNN